MRGVACIVAQSPLTKGVYIYSSITVSYFMLHALLDTVIYKDEVARYPMEAVDISPRFEDQEFAMSEGFHVPNLTFQL
jgi:hypothetical protein